MRLLPVFVTSVFSATPRDLCTQLCQRDGPAICSGGSWTKPDGSCHAYLFRGDPARNDYCYHTSATAAVCPAGGRTVRVTDVPRLLGSERQGTRVAVPEGGPGPSPTNTSSGQGVVEPPALPPAITPVLTADNQLRTLLARYSRAADLCRDHFQLMVAIGRIITNLEPAGLRFSDYWEQVGGSRLLELAREDSDCKDLLMASFIVLATRPNIARSDSVEAARVSGLSEVCREDPDSLIRILEYFASRTGWAGPGSDLALFCPEIFESFEMRAHAVRHMVIRISREIAGAYPLIIFQRNRAFSESIPFLRGVGGRRMNLPIVEYLDSSGSDRGGHGRDWFTMVGRQIFTSTTDVAGGLFRARQGSDWLELDPTRPLTDASRLHYEAVGGYLAISVRNELPVGVSLPRFFFNHLLNERVDFADLEQDDPQMAQELGALRDADPGALRTLMRLEEHEPLPTVEAYIQERLRGLVLADRMAAIREGFNRFLPIEDMRRVLSAGDFRTLVLGSPDISVDDIIDHTDVEFDALEDLMRVVPWIWEWLRGASTETRRRFVEFVTGLRHLPLGGLGSVGIRIGVTRSARYYSHRNLTPRADSRTFILELPVYASRAELEEWMTAAVSRFGFSMS